MIETEIRDYIRDYNGQKMLIVKTVLDKVFFDEITYGNNYGGLMEQIAQKIAENIYPEMEKRILSDPQFKERIINDVLLRIADRFAKKRKLLNRKIKGRNK